MDDKKYTNEELDKILEDIDNKKYKGDVIPERIFIGKDKDALSIPIESGTKRRVFERDSDGNWQEAPHAGERPPA
ncbi:hypothetical protein [Thiohalophilus sp.]|uniref:hypothetical protein n=1 Tax=Thiohalophilus sp. TaxID=3028392 RepID=UPI002ACE78B9|nr:hypothetical protein [Thiohalophilus sp.]MDZ7660913.1 hypothetical protein [Thiohalophilus sp.]